MNKSLFKVFSLITVLALVLMALPMQSAQAIGGGSGSVSLTTLGSAYTQDFNTLANTGTTNSITVINGWFLDEGNVTATANNGLYAAGIGSSNAGDTYSFGAATSSERAFGGLLSGSVNPTIGAQFTNNTGSEITSLAISYTGEMWRAGVTNRGAADRLDFQLSTNATSLTTGTWADYDSLDFNSPNINTALGLLNGNLAGNRTALSFSITGISIPNGASFWIRWTDFNIANSDDGLSVDDFSLTPSQVDLAPEVSSTFPSNGSTNFPIDANLTVTFSEPVDVTNLWFELSCTVSGSVTASYSGGPITFTIDPSAPLSHGEDCTLTIVSTEVSDQDTNDPPQNMIVNFEVGFMPFDACSATYTPIYDIQGSGPTAALTGAQTTKGIVVGDYEGPTPNSRGFFLQDPTGDGNTATSDGIFVFNGNNNNVNLGDLVYVSGNVSEFNNQTQISASSLVNCGVGSVFPVDVSLPVPTSTYLEQYEGMLVRFPQTLYVTEHFQLGRFGEVVMSANGRLQQPTNVVLPGAPALALQAANNLNRIVVDDSFTNQNPDPIIFGRNGLPLSASNTLRGGDTTTGMVGVLTFAFSAYRIFPTNSLGGGLPNFVAANPRPSNPPDVGGTLKVTGMNLLNLFNTFDGLPDNVDNCTLGVGGGATDCRGADTQAEFDRQWPKTVAAILAMNPDVIGVNEIENDGYGTDSSIQFLVDQLNAATAPGTYAFIDVDTATGQVNAMGTDAIKVGILYKPASVTPVGQTSPLNTEAFVNGGDSAPRSRPSLAQAFEQNANGEVFIVDVNHLKSKGSACDLADQGDGQGNCNQVRVNAATELMNWLATDPTGTGDTDILLIGDYNSYAMEDPIMVIQNSGFTNLISSFLGPDAYSYVFDGQWGYLDHALGSASILSQITGVGDYHINSDEPLVLDYNTNFKSAGQITSLYAADQFRVSDHDSVMVGLCMPPTLDVTVSPDSLWPPNHKYVTVGASFDSSADVASVTLLSITSNEPDSGQGNGDKPNDIVIVDNETFKLRAERSGGGEGRIYTITYQATNTCGNTVTTTATVTVPHDQGN